MNTVKAVYQQKVICNDIITGNNTVHYGIWSSNVYSTCPEGNINHTWVDTIVLCTVKNNSIMEISNTTGTNKYYRNQEFKFTIPSGPMTELQIIGTHIFPYNLRIVKGILAPTIDNIGDRFSIYNLPPTPVGSILTAVDTGTLVHVDTTSLSAIKIGMEIILDNGVYNQNLGECISIDYTTQNITVENSIANTFNIGTYIIVKIPIVKDLTILDTSKIKFGSSVEGNKLLLQGYIMEVCYMRINNSNSTAYFRGELLV